MLQEPEMEKNACDQLTFTILWQFEYPDQLTFSILWKSGSPDQLAFSILWKSEVAIHF